MLQAVKDEAKGDLVAAASASKRRRDFADLRLANARCKRHLFRCGSNKTAAALMGRYDTNGLQIPIGPSHRVGVDAQHFMKRPDCWQLITLGKCPRSHRGWNVVTDLIVGGNPRNGIPVSRLPKFMSISKLVHFWPNRTTLIFCTPRGVVLFSGLLRHDDGSHVEQACYAGRLPAFPTAAFRRCDLPLSSFNLTLPDPLSNGQGPPSNSMPSNSTVALLRNPTFRFHL